MSKFSLNVLTIRVLDAIFNLVSKSVRQIKFHSLRAEIFPYLWFWSFFLNKRPGVVQPIQLKMRCVLAVVFHGLSNDTYLISISHIRQIRFLVTSFSFAPRTVILERQPARRTKLEMKWHDREREWERECLLIRSFFEPASLFSEPPPKKWRGSENIFQKEGWPGI